MRIFGKLSLILLSTVGIVSCSTSSKVNPSSLYNSEMENSGWWGENRTEVPFPHGYDRPPVPPIPSDRLAISSRGCQNPFHGYNDPRWELARERCREYQQVDLFVSLDRDFDRPLSRLAAAHPWRAQGMQSRVILLRPRSVRELQREMSNLAMSCKVIRNMVWYAHGNLGTMYTGDRHAITTSVLGAAVTPCSFMPGSRIQSGICFQGCGQVAESLRLGLHEIFNDPRLIPASGQSPFEGMEFLFYTDSGEAIDNDADAFFRMNRSGARSVNGVNIVYRVHSGQIVSDININQIQDCRGNPNDPHLRVRPISTHERDVLEHPLRGIQTSLGN